MSDLLQLIFNNFSHPNKHDSLYRTAIDIIDKAPDFKIRDIVQSNPNRLNKILAKLIALTLDFDSECDNPHIVPIQQHDLHQEKKMQVNSNQATHVQQLQKVEQSRSTLTPSPPLPIVNDAESRLDTVLLSLRKISTLGMTNENLFLKYSDMSDDIKYDILSYLDENEIHWIMSNVNHNWHTLCRNTFGHAKFKFTFKEYFFNLIGNGDDSIGTRVYVQCPWNLLWTYGKVIDSDVLTGLTVEVTTKDYDPFLLTNGGSVLQETNQSNKQEDDDEDQNDNENKKEEDTIDDVKPKTQARMEKEKERKDNVENGDNEVDCLKKLNNVDIKTYKTRITFSYLDIRDDIFQYHPIAPINTIDTIKPKEESSKRILNELVINNKMLQEDFFKRPLVDVQLPFVDNKLKIQVKTAADDHEIDESKTAEKNDKNMAIECSLIEWPYTYKPNIWRPGIVDIYALDMEFPNWRSFINDSMTSDSNSDHGKIFQIPVLVDIVELLGSSDFEDLTKIPSAVYYHASNNLYKYGKNRHFTRIWIHPCRKLIQFSNNTTEKKQKERQKKEKEKEKDKDKDEDESKTKKEYVSPIQEFGTKASANWRQALLASPMLMVKGKDNFQDNIDNNSNNNNILDYNFIKRKSLVPISKVLNDFVIKIDSDFGKTEFDKLHEKYPNKMLLFCDYDGEWMEVFITDQIVDDTAKNSDSGDDKTENKRDADRGRRYQLVFSSFKRYCTLTDSYFDESMKAEKDSRDDDNGVSNNIIENFKNFNYFYNAKSLCFRQSLVSDLGQIIRQFIDRKDKHGILVYNTETPSEKAVVSMIENLMECEGVKWDLSTHVPISIDIKAQLISLMVSEDGSWIKDIGYNPHSKIETPDLHFENAPYDNLRFSRPAYCFECKNTFGGNKWKHGIWWVERKKFKDLAYGFNGYLWDTMGQLTVIIDITDEFDQFQENVLKPYWLKYRKININSIKTDSKDNKDDDDENKDNEKKDNKNAHEDENDNELKWDNRKYFMDCYSIYWNKANNRVFYQYNVHLDDQEQVAPFGTHSFA